MNFSSNHSVSWNVVNTTSQLLDLVVQYLLPTFSD